MGALHEGHLQLVDEARRLADVVVMSLFVNPLQFGPGEDLARYPRDLEADSARAASRGVDVLFAPGPDEMFPHPVAVLVKPVELGELWEGAARPGHFSGVLTVVAKLLNIVQPAVAIFGQKDYQQLTLIRAMSRDLSMPVEIATVPTFRDADGLALSSRNVYLSPEERARALAIPRALAAIKQAFVSGEYDSAKLLEKGVSELCGDGGLTVDYLALVDPLTLRPVARANASSVALVAARAGATRLIDNAILGE
jgi:pantoate--beta-alanine ligase